MILSVTLPRLGVATSQVSMHRMIAKAGDDLRPGTPLLEVRVDLGGQMSQDCPPVSFYRIIATERAYLQSITSTAVLEAGSSLGVATTDRNENPAGTAVRSLRTSSIAIQIDPLSR